MSRPKEEYLALRRRFEPAQVKLAVVAESPPVSGNYFYDPDGRVTEPLFSALMKSMAKTPETKERGLRAFQERGWVLVDATYEPVNGMTNRARDKVILRDQPSLIVDLRRLRIDEPLPVVLVKVNVCKLLEQPLLMAGFRVLNDGQSIPFPSHGQQKRFHKRFSAVVDAAGLP